MAYTLEQGRFPSANGVDSIAWRIYRPAEGKALGMVQLSHGMCEYIARYEPWIERLTDKGWIVAGNDHLGHGDSAASPEGLGYFAPQNGYNAMVEDLYAMSELLRKKHRGTPLFLLGHSMGSFLAREYISRFGGELNGVILSGTAGSNPATKMGILLTKQTIKKNGDHFRSDKLTQLAFGKYNARTAKCTDKDWLTRDDAVVDRYMQDPYCQFTFTAGAYLDLFTLLQKVTAPDWAKRVTRSLPVLLIAGEEDPVGAYGKGPQETCQRLLAAGVQKVQLILYPSCRHEVHNELEPERSRMMGDVESFLQENLQR